MAVTDLQFVCPTHGRAGHVDVLKLVPDVLLVVSESQFPIYKGVYPDARYDVHPDSVVGLAHKRNWMVKKYGNVFMFDDDVIEMRDLSILSGVHESPHVPTEKVLPIIRRTADQCHDMGAYLFGFNTHANPITFAPQAPFRLTNYVAGWASGLLEGHGLWWHPEVLQDDYWISLLNAYFHRKCFVDTRYHVMPRPVFKVPGGQGHHRTVERERQGLEVMRRTFGEVVRARKSGSSHVARLTHDSQPTIVLPF